MTEHTAALPEMEPQPARRNGRGLVAVIASVLAVVLIAGGGFAAWQFFFAGGPRPAEVLPDTTFALATVDLDPSGGQKIEAIKTLRKFPSWRKRTGITPESDVVKAIFDEALKGGPCKSLDYERDVKSWIGSRAGVGGVVLGDGKPAPVFVLQITDAENAESGFARLAKCANGDDEEFGWTIADDYIVASDSKPHAEAIASAGKESPLAENADFQKWTEEAGGPGILNVFVGRKVVDVLSDIPGGEVFGLPLDGAAPDTETDDELAKTFKDFKGAAAGLKFNDGGIDLSFASSGAKAEKGRTVGDHVGALPADTTAVVAVALPEKAIDALKESDMADDDSPFSLGDLFGESSGLDLPEDLITLLGESLSISLGGDAPADLSDIASPADIPLGLLIKGDTDAIKAVIAKAETAAGMKLSELPATLSSDDEKVAITSTPDYGEELLGKGSLADEKNFKDVVSHADESLGVIYVSFDGEWMDAARKLAAEEDDKDAKEVADDLAVLRAFGASAWNEGDVGHGLIRVALK